MGVIAFKIASIKLIDNHHTVCMVIVYNDGYASIIYETYRHTYIGECGTLYVGLSHILRNLIQKSTV